MKQKPFVIIFEDAKLVRFAFSMDEAVILAQADRIKEGKSWKAISAWEETDPKYK